MRAMSFLNLSEFDQAQKAFEVLIEKHPDAALAWSGYGYNAQNHGTPGRRRSRAREGIVSGSGSRRGLVEFGKPADIPVFSCRP